MPIDFDILIIRSSEDFLEQKIFEVNELECKIKELSNFKHLSLKKIKLLSIEIISLAHHYHLCNKDFSNLLFIDCINKVISQENAIATDYSFNIALSKLNMIYAPDLCS